MGTVPSSAQGTVPSVAAEGDSPPRRWTSSHPAEPRRRGGQSPLCYTPGVRLSSRVLLSEEQIRQRVEAMAVAIAADTPDGNTLSVLVLMDGAFMFCADLVRRFPLPVRLAFVPVLSVSRGGDVGRIAIPLDFPIADADVLIVEDILDTGLTLGALKSRLEACGPARLRIAVLLDKPARRKLQVRPDYVGFTVPDTWVVGYGLDVDGLFRNLPYITHLEEAVRS